MCAVVPWIAVSVFVCCLSIGSKYASGTGITTRSEAVCNGNDIHKRHESEWLELAANANGLVTVPSECQMFGCFEGRAVISPHSLLWHAELLSDGRLQNRFLRGRTGELLMWKLRFSSCSIISSKCLAMVEKSSSLLRIFWPRERFSWSLSLLSDVLMCLVWRLL